MQLFWFIYFNQLYMFRAMFSPIIRNISLNYSCPPLLLVAGVAYAVSSYSDMLMMMGENIARNM